MNYKKRLTVYISCLLLCGCWNRLELNELSVIIGTAVDFKDDLWKVSFQVINPPAIATQAGGGGGGDSPVTVFSTSGKTLLEAIQNINLESPRTPFFAHNRVLIISEKVAKDKGIVEVMDFFLREAETRETMDIALSKGEARDLLEILQPQEKIPANGIDQMFKKTEDNLSSVRRVKMIDFVKAFASPPASAIAPEITISGGNAEEQSSLDALKESSKKVALKIGDIGVFKKDRLIGWLKQSESKGINWLTDKIEGAAIAFPCPNSEEITSSFDIERSSTKISPIMDGENIKIIANIQPEGVLNETGCELDLTIPANINKLESKIEAQLKNDIYTTWRSAKELRADVFGFADKIHKKYPKEWKKIKPDWENKMTEIDLQLSIDAKIKRTGMINNPFSKLMTE